MINQLYIYFFNLILLYMESYCVKCKRQTLYDGEPELTLTKNKRYMLKGLCKVCGKMKARFVSKSFVEQNGKCLIGKLFKLPNNKIPFLGDIPLIGKLLF